MVGLDSRLRDIVGGPTAAALEKAFDLRRAGDLLSYYPRRYVRNGGLSDLAELRPGDHITVVAVVASSRIRPMQRRSGNILEVSISDGQRSLRLTFFKQDWRLKLLRPGVRGLFAGQLSLFNGTPQLTHPTCQLFATGAEPAGADAVLEQAAFIPIYPATAAVPSWSIALAVSVTLDAVGEAPDPLPADIRGEQALLGYSAALRAIHQPATPEELEQARRRLKWDEALTVQVAFARRRADAQSVPATAWVARRGGLRERFEQGLPYELTGGQIAVGAEIDADLREPRPMHRLLSGEVGSGKTVVALRAMLTVLDGGGQAALLAPTEVLAVQHLRSLRDLLGPLGRAGELDGDPDSTRVALLTGAQGAAERRAAKAAVADGRAGIVVGTHALLTEDVRFRELGLVVVDEQHRFGVEQRAVLRERGLAGRAPHLLVMTATPIPRTVAMTVFGDLATSELTELPRGRQEIATHVVAGDRPAWLDRMWAKVREEARSGRQAYVVCPRIDPDESDIDDGGEPAGRPLAAASEVLARLRTDQLAGLRLGLLHGKLGRDEKDAVMRAFVGRELDVLVATTVIEVGIDVPNATVMVVLDADSFGVSQLHQLRGRIGRGAHPSTCLLHTTLPQGAPGYARVAAVAATRDGSELALVDLRQRGEGDVLGASQAGRRGALRLLRLLDDRDLIVAARMRAQELVAADPHLTAHPVLATAVDRLSGVGDDPVAFLEKG